MLGTEPLRLPVATFSAVLLLASPVPAWAEDREVELPAGRLAYGRYRPNPWVAAGIGVAAPWMGATTLMSAGIGPEAVQNVSALLYVGSFGVGTLYAGDPIAASGPIAVGILLPLAAGAAGFMIGGLQALSQPPCGGDIVCLGPDANAGFPLLVSRTSMGVTVGTVAAGLFSGLNAYHTARRVGGWDAEGAGSAALSP